MGGQEEEKEEHTTLPAWEHVKSISRVALPRPHGPPCVRTVTTPPRAVGEAGAPSDTVPHCETWT
jgi:hypothetical protein